MNQQITYYAIVDDLSSREDPAGVLRRIEDAEGAMDEAFTSDLKWEFSPLLYSAERGDLTNTLYPIGEEEAMQIVERIRREAGAPG
jgi:hypothetical protein